MRLATGLEPTKSSTTGCRTGATAFRDVPRRPDILCCVDRGVQRACAWCGPIFLILFLIGFWFVAGLVPPPSPARNAVQIAHFYQAHATRLRAGMLIAMVATAFMAPFLALLTLQIKRHSPRLAPLAYAQLICGVALLILILVPMALVALAAFRPDRPPADTQLLNDAAFVILFWVFSTPTLEYLSLGAAVLLDRSERPLFPRWVGWFDLVVGVVFAMGAPVVFVKSGPFAWNGALAFWAVLIAFGAWIWITFGCMLRAVNRPELATATPAG